MRDRCERREWAVLVLALTLPSVTATARPRCSIDVAVDPGLRTATGSVAIDLENVSDAPLAAVELWRFPARLEHPSPTLNDYDFHWHFPRAFSRGAMAVEGISVDGRTVAGAILDDAVAGPGTILEIPLVPPLPPGGRIRVAARFRTDLPRRYGSFGCYDGGCTLSGGFYPMPVELGRHGYDRSAPPARVDLAVTVAAPPGLEVRVNGLENRAHAATLVDGAAWALITISRGAGERRLVHRGVTISLLSHSPPPSPPTPPGKAAPYLREDRAELVLDDVREALDLLHELGLDPPAGTLIPLIEAPLRMELAEPHPGAVLVSDQIFRILPLGRFRKFHSFQLVRAVFASLAEQRLAARERPRDLAWSPDVLASWLVDLFTLRTYRRAEFAHDVLKWVAFIPTVDRILYAPQIPFASAYFNTLDEPDPTRDDARRFSNARPRGKVLYEKLRDRLGDPAMATVARSLWAGTPVREAAEGVAGTDLERFFSLWLGPYPAVDYRFKVLGSERIKGGKLIYKIKVYKVGSNPPDEPVEMRVTEWGGARHDLKWDGQGREGVLVVETARSIESIELDPRGRLLERLPGANDDLRLNNRSPSELKFIYNNFGALINLQTLALDLSLDFTLNRIYDVKNGTRFVLFRSETAQIGGSASYSRYFGRMITPSQLSSAASLAVSVARLEASFGRVGERALPGTRISIGAGIGYDDRLFVWEPSRANAASASASYTATVQDDGRLLQQVTFAGELERIQPLAIDHQLAFLLAGAATFGDLGVPTQMLSAGSPTWLRGYEPDELLGRMRGIARIEYRHVFVHDLDWNLFHTLYVRGIGGGAFAEAGIISPCGSYAVGEKDLFGDVGYSLRLFADWLGVSQTVLNLDVAVPLVRRERGCFLDAGATPVPTSARAPVGIFLYFGPVW